MISATRAEMILLQVRDVQRMKYIKEATIYRPTHTHSFYDALDMKFRRLHRHGRVKMEK